MWPATQCDLVSAFAERYPDPNTRHQHFAELGDLFRVTGRRHPSELCDAGVPCVGISGLWIGPDLLGEADRPGALGL